MYGKCASGAAVSTKHQVQMSLIAQSTTTEWPITTAARTTSLETSTPRMTTEAQSTTTEWPTTTAARTTSLETSTPRMTTEGQLPSLQVVATPDYPVTEGRTVHLYCGPSTIPDSVNWSWKHWKTLEDSQEVGHLRDLTLTRPEQSGTYQCFANNTVSSRRSSSHIISITSTHTTVAEKLGIAAFVFFLLALIAIFGILFWLGYQRLVATKTTSNTAAKGFPGTDKSPKGGFPPAESGDVYMNYTGNDYTNLDLTNVTGNDYSSL